MDNRFIQKLERFATLEAADRAVLQRLCDNTRNVAAHRDLIREGDRPGPFLIFMQGWGCRSKLVPNGQRQVVALMMPGDCCDLHAGALAEMDHTIQTLTAASVAIVARPDMDRLTNDHPNLVRALYISQLIDEGTSRAWMVSMGRRSSRERIAHLMCELYLRARNVGIAEDNRMSLPLTQTLLADAVGMTPVHVNRVLKELRVGGAMEIRRGWLEIVDPVKLVRIAGFDETYLHRRLAAVDARAGQLR